MTSYNVGDKVNTIDGPGWTIVRINNVEVTVRNNIGGFSTLNIGELRGHDEGTQNVYSEAQTELERMSVTITITLTDDSHTAVEHAIGHARAIEREFERVGCPARFEVTTGSSVEHAVTGERQRILGLLKDERQRRVNYEAITDSDPYFTGGVGALDSLWTAITTI